MIRRRSHPDPDRLLDEGLYCRSKGESTAKDQPRSRPHLVSLLEVVDHAIIAACDSNNRLVAQRGNQSFLITAANVCFIPSMMDSGLLLGAGEVCDPVGQALFPYPLVHSWGFDLKY